MLATLGKHRPIVTSLGNSAAIPVLPHAQLHCEAAMEKQRTCTASHALDSHREGGLHGLTLQGASSKATNLKLPAHQPRSLRRSIRPVNE